MYHELRGFERAQKGASKAKQRCDDGISPSATNKARPAPPSPAPPALLRGAGLVNGGAGRAATESEAGRSLPAGRRPPRRRLSPAPPHPDPIIRTLR